MVSLLGQPQPVSLTEQPQPVGLFDLRTAVEFLFDAIQEQSENKGRLFGLPSSFPGLDSLTSGLRNADLIVVAGRTGMGTTSFCMTIVKHLAVDQQIPVAIFSLQQSKEEILRRILSTVSGVDRHRFKTGHLTADNWKALAEARTRLMEAPIFIDDDPTPSVEQIDQKCMRFATETGPIELIVIDDLQRLRDVQEMTERSRQEQRQIANTLKRLALKLNVPIILTSEVQPAVDFRPNRRPMLSDLGAGLVAEDCDLVMFLYRPEYYNPADKNCCHAELHIAKQSNGPIGCIQLIFDHCSLAFEEALNYRYPDGSITG